MVKMPIPIATLNQHIAVLGKTRSGKSSAMRVLAEHMLDDHRPICIVDPKGDWWGVKSSRDGKGAGYPVVIFGGPHADVPINEHSGPAIAELIATGNRPSLIDLKGWMPAERTRFWVAFASTLFKLTKGLRWLFVDEIHNFAPKAGHLDPDSAKALHWTNRLASEGLGMGLHMVFASQRPQKVHNDTLTSAETLIAMRVIHPSDRDAVSDWIKGCGDPKLGSMVLGSLADMNRGEGWVWSPEIKFGPKRIQFPMFETYDSFKPQPDNATQKLKGWASVDLEEVKTKLAKVVEEAKANDPSALKARVAALEKDLAIARAAPVASLSDGMIIEAAYKDGLANGRVNGLNENAVQIKTLMPMFAELVGHATAIHSALSLLAKPMPAPGVKKIPPLAVVERALPSAHRVAAHPPTSSGPGEKMPVGERSVLTALAQYPDGLSRSHISILTGYARSTRDKYIQLLGQRGFCSAGDPVKITSEGFAGLGDYSPLPTGDALRQHWMTVLPEGERRVLELLCSVFPAPIGRDSISDQTGYARSTRDKYLQLLAVRKLVVSAGPQVKASPELFEENRR
jgi:hypothetical protein